MKQLAVLWFDAPHWARGLFLGNICYVILAVFGYRLIDYSFWDQVWLEVILAPLLWPMLGAPINSGIFLYHAAWCLLGALFVQLFGERKGTAVLIVLLYGVGIAVIIYVLTHLSISF